MLPPGELTCIKLATVRAQKLHILWWYLSWSFFCPFVACLLIALENHSFYWSKCYYRTSDMFRAQNFSCSNNTVPCSPSQGNSCTVNDWDTLFYPAHVVASELPGPHSCWLLCLECATRTCLLLHQGWQCGRLKTAHRGWMDSSWSQHHRVGQCF